MSRNFPGNRKLILPLYQRHHSIMPIRGPDTFFILLQRVRYNEVTEGGEGVQWAVGSGQ